MIDSLLRLAIERRVLFLSFVLLIVGAGIWSYQKLPIDAVPDITNVQVQINTSAPGYSPLEAEQRITYPVETALAGLPRLDYTRSLSRYGLSQVTVVFKEGTDIYFARSLINERLSAIKSNLPDGLEPEMGPVSTGLGEIFMYTVQASEDARMADGQPYTATALREIQDWIIKPQLAQVEGVIEVNSIGGYNKQYHVMPDPTKLLYYQIGLHDLVEALQENNENRGAGYIERNGQQLLVRSPGQLSTIAEIANVVVAQQDQLPIKVSDVADIAIGKELRTGAATRDGQETVLGTAMMLIGENSRTVARDVALKLEDIQASLPRRCHCRSGLRSNQSRGQSDCHSCKKPDGRRAIGHRYSVFTAGKYSGGVDYSGSDPSIHAHDDYRHGANWRISQSDEPWRTGLWVNRRWRSDHR